MTIKVIEKPIKISDVQEIANHQFGDMVKFVVDVEKEILAIGGDLHADEEAILIEKGSDQNNLWGINYYLGRDPAETIEFDSMINIRPSQNNRSREVENPKNREKIMAIVKKLVI
jgi:hypothetical protein